MRTDVEELVVKYRESREEVYLQELMQKNTGLFHILAGGYLGSIPNSELEDLISESYIAMLDAIRDFDLNRGFHFSTLLKAYVRQRLNKLYHTETRKKRYTGASLVSYESLVEKNCEGGCERPTWSIECEGIRLIELREELASLSLSAREKVVVEILLGGRNKGEVAKALQVKPATVTYYLRGLQKKFKLAGVFL